MFNLILIGEHFIGFLSLYTFFSQWITGENSCGSNFSAGTFLRGEHSIVSWWGYSRRWRWCGIFDRDFRAEFMSRFTNWFTIGRGFELFVMRNFIRRFGERRLFTRMRSIEERQNKQNEFYSSGSLCFLPVGKTEEICCVDGCNGRRVRCFG